MDLIPPADRVIVRQLPPETRTAFGLELPETAQQGSLRAVVLAVGRGLDFPDGQRRPLGVHRDSDGLVHVLRRGDEVILPRHSGGTEITLEDGETVISILASDLLAVVA